MSLVNYAITHFPKFWDHINQNDCLSNFINPLAINALVNITEPRPRPFSLRSDYSTWPSLTDRKFSGRHLPVADQAWVDKLPPIDKVAELFYRPADSEGVICDRSSTLFPAFAQWFTDGFLRTHPTDSRKNTSNQEIELCQVYGLNEDVTNALREHQSGRLLCQQLNGEDYPPYVFNPDGTPKPEFALVDYLPPAGHPLTDMVTPRKDKIFAMGTDRSNSTVGYISFNTLFLREHNRICGELATRNPSWDDERLFQTTRNIMIVILIKIVVEDYINHISPSYFRLKADPTFAYKEDWYRTNWITLEFNLLYRWHALMPNQLRIGENMVEFPHFMYHSDLVVDNGLAKIFDGMSRQRATRLDLQNTATYLWAVEEANINLSRKHRLQSYNSYRKCFGFAPAKTFKELTSSPEKQKLLQDLYGNVDNVEYYVGMYAEDHGDRALMGSLMGAMVAVDAFTQALTNPLLSKNVFNKNTFTDFGLETISNTPTIKSLVDRNTQGSPDFKCVLGYSE